MELYALAAASYKQQNAASTRVASYTETEAAFYRFCLAGICISMKLFALAAETLSLHE